MPSAGNMPAQEKEKVIRAISELGRRVTAADVATKTGLPVLVVSSELNKVAAETGGHLQVATTGDIAYNFDLGFQSAYLARGVQRVFEEVGKKAFEVAYFILRISFGIALIASLLIIILAMVVIVFSSNRTDDRDDQGGSFDFIDFMLWRELFYGLFWWNYDPYPAIGQQGQYGAAGYGQEKFGQRRGKKGNFLLTCFSFLFGDGDPNRDLEDRHWQNIAALIKMNNGAVTANQLAPYTSGDPKDEDAVLPVLVRFDGRPEVTESGNIIYLFSSLQATATEVHQNNLPSFLRERTWVFSQSSTDELTPVVGLALANFLGSWWLFSLACRPPYLLYTWLPLFQCLVIYGTLFVLVPAIRWSAISWFNARIEARNARREGFALALKNPDAELAKKLSEAATLSQKDTLIDSGNIVYTTDRDELEQEFEKPPGN